ncbi:MAG: dTDP-4-dehydrorhamnose reductase [Planctomycetota bacterium]
MKVLVAGAAGMLGRKILEVFAGRAECVPTSLAGEEDGPGFRTLDLRDERAIEDRLASERPDAVINCAAYTAVDRCEDEETLAFEINAEAPGRLAAACARRGVRFVHFSTDYVFDGRLGRAYAEDDAPSPESAYGRTKLEGERRVREAGGDWLIARIQWLYGEHGPNFAETMLRLAASQPRLRVVSDQFGSPTYTGDVARETLRLLEARQSGLFHVTNRGETSWHGFARAVLDRGGWSGTPIDAITTAEFPRPARRPAYSVLENRRLEATIGRTMRVWTEALDEYMERRRPAGEAERARGEAR